MQGKTASETEWNQEESELAMALMRLYQAGRYRKALPLAERLENTSIKSGKSKSAKTAVVITVWGTIYLQMGMYGKALPLLQRGLKAIGKIFRPEHAITAQRRTIWEQMTSPWGYLRKRCHRSGRPWRFVAKSWGRSRPNSCSLHNLAMVYHQMGANDQALPLAQQALKKREKLRAPNTLKPRKSPNALAEIERDMADLQQALPLAKRALSIREEIRGPNHPDTAIRTLITWRLFTWQRGNKEGFVLRGRGL